MTLRLAGSTSGYTEIDCPSVGGNNTLVLPTGNGSSGQVLSTNGSGALSWAGGGKLLQVVQAFKSDTASGNSNAYTDVTGLSVSITPASTANKILVMANINITSGGYFQGKIIRGTTDIAIGDAASLRTRSSFGGYNFGSFGGGFSFGVCKLDSPASTSSQTYKLQIIATTSATWYINRGQNDSDEANQGRQVSSITVMEVAA